MMTAHGQRPVVSMMTGLSFGLGLLNLIVIIPSSKARKHSPMALQRPMARTGRFLGKVRIHLL